MEKLGINLTYLITQIVNFTILLIVLTKVVYKPILRMLEKRKRKIEEGLALTEKLNKEKEEIEIKKALILKEAQKEAQAILDKARSHAKLVEVELVKEAKVKAEEIIKKGRKEVELRKKELEEKLLKETVRIATVLTRKLIGEVLDEKRQEIFFRKRLGEFLKSEKNF